MVLSPSPRILFFYYIIPLQLLASTISGIGFVLSDSRFLLAGFIIWSLWFILMFFTTFPITDKYILKARLYGKIKRGSRIILIFFMVLGITEIILLCGFHESFARLSMEKGTFPKILASFDRGFGYNDGTALNHQAAINLMSGRNPYTNSNIIIALLQFKPSADRITALRRGEFSEVFPHPTEEQLEDVWQKAMKNPWEPRPEIESSLSYPAGSFLLPIPFLLIGIEDFRLIYLIYILIALIFVFVILPRDKRIFFCGALLLSFDLWNCIANGETGALVFPFLMLAWVLLNRNWWLSAAFMGVAIAIKQTAWFFIPFYLITSLKLYRIKNAGYMGLITGGIFLLFNLPFIIDDPSSWFMSVLTPMSRDMFPAGVGLVSLVTSGIWHNNSPLIFNVLELIVFVTGIIWYYFHVEKYPQTGLLLAILPLFFAWRSLWPYFFYTGLIVLGLILLDAPLRTGNNCSY